MAKNIPKCFEWSKEQFEKKKNDSCDMDIHEVLHSTKTLDYFLT